MSIILMTRRAVLKTGLLFGGAALLSINCTHKAIAAGKRLKASMKDRINSVYAADSAFPIRCSQDNTQVQALYKNFLTEPGGSASHKLLHMHFTDRSDYIKKLRDEGKLKNPGAAEFEKENYPYEWT